MGLFRPKRGDSIEKRLRAERPEPPDQLVRSIVDSIREPRRRRVPVRGLARVGALSSAVLVGLLAVGGLGYAMSTVSDVLVKFTSSKVVEKQSALKTVAANPANDQYGTTTTTTSGGGGGGGTTTTTTTTVSSTTTTTAGGTAVATVQPGTTGSVQVNTPSGNQVAVSWGTGFASANVQVHVDTTPPVTGTSFLGQNNSIVAITITNPQTGQPVHQLPAPLDIAFKDTPPGFVPAVSEDGVNFRALKQIAGPPLPDTMQDGYYVDATGVHVLTRHVTLFAVLYKANVAVSESGRKTATAGSGKFGDPTRMHVGAPGLRFTQNPTANGKTVQFTFFVDEQAAMYFHVLSGGKSQRIVVDRSAIRRHGLDGRTRRTLHIAILRPGTIRMTLQVATGMPDSVMLTAVDFDGHKVTKTAKIK